MAAHFSLVFAMVLAGVNNLSSAFVLPIATAPATRTARQAGLSHASLPVAETAEDVMPDSQTMSEVSSHPCAEEEGSGGASYSRYAVGQVDSFPAAFWVVYPLDRMCSNRFSVVMCR